MTKFPLLCAMMFLQFFVWGAWYVTAGTFVPAMGWDQSTTGWVYSAGPIAAMISATAASISVSLSLRGIRTAGETASVSVQKSCLPVI